MSIAELRKEISESQSGGQAKPRGVSRAGGDTPREGIKKRLNDPNRLKEMERRGLIKLGSGSIPSHFWDMSRPEDPEGGAVQALLDERESSRF